MRLDELPKSERIEDRRGRSSGVPGGRGSIGIGAIVVLGLIGWATGIDPRLLIRGAEMLSGSGGTQQKADVGSETKTGAPPDEMGRFVSAVLGSTEVQWADIFAQSGKAYKPPTLVMFSGATQSGCGFAKSAMGPFYCPLDKKVYLDTSFFQDLERRFRACDAGSKTCQFSQAYVIAHEIGHHVQNLLGLLPKVQEAQRAMGKADANSLQVRVELQAIVSLAFGRIGRKRNGNLLSPVMSKLQCRRHQLLATIDCNDSRRVMLCRTRLRMALRHNVRVGSRPA